MNARTGEPIGRPLSHAIAVAARFETATFVTDIEAWFEALVSFADVSFMDERTQQPPMPAAGGLFV